MFAERAGYADSLPGGRNIRWPAHANALQDTHIKASKGYARVQAVSETGFGDNRTPQPASDIALYQPQIWQAAASPSLVQAA